MEMAYRQPWEAEIAEMRRVLAGFAMKEERKWGKPTYTVDGKNVVIMQGFKEYFGLGFFQGALLKDPKKVLVQRPVQAGRVMKFTSVKDLSHGEGGDHQGLRARGHRSREGWAADRAEEDLRFSGSRGADGAVPKGHAVQARLRGADAGAAEELPLPLCRGQAVGDAGDADRKGNAGDIRRQRIPGEALVIHSTLA